MTIAFMFNGLFWGLSVLACVLSVMIMICVMAFKDTHNISKILGQILSARWILAVLAGIAFLAFCAAITVAIVSQRMEFKPEVIVSVLGMLLLVIQGVYKDYFHRNRENEGSNNGNGDNGAEAKPPVNPPEVK